MKKVILFIFLTLIIFLIGCSKMVDLSESNIKILAINYSGDTTNINCRNINQKGYYKFKISLVNNENKINPVYYVIETSISYADKGYFSYKIKTKENFFISTIDVFSKQNGEWLKTDSKIFYFPA